MRAAEQRGLTCSWPQTHPFPLVDVSGSSPIHSVALRPASPALPLTQPLPLLTVSVSPPLTLAPTRWQSCHPQKPPLSATPSSRKPGGPRRAGKRRGQDWLLPSPKGCRSQSSHIFTASGGAASPRKPGPLSPEHRGPSVASSHPSLVQLDRARRYDR